VQSGPAVEYALRLEASARSMPISGAPGQRIHNGHRARAAAELGVATKTLYNKVRNQGIDSDEWA